MALAERAVSQSVRPLSEYPGSHANIVGSKMIRNGKVWERHFYYDGPVNGAESVIGITGQREWMVVVPQGLRPLRTLNVTERKPVQPTQIR